jgi:predicted O-methyltransferase YrrM
LSRITWPDDGADRDASILAGIPFRIGDVEYLSTMSEQVLTSRLCVLKPPKLIDETAELLRAHRGANIFEMGIRFGGSAAMIAQLAEPRKLVAIELEAEPVVMFEEFIDATNRRDTVRPYYGVDQSDRTRLTEILDAEFGEEPIDLVMDDASHLLDETRASFEVLLPRMRPGGLYIIEDWNWQHLMAVGVNTALEDAAGRDSAELDPEQAEVREKFRAELEKALADPSSPAYASFVDWMERRESDPDSRPAPVKPPTRPLTILIMELLVARAVSGDAIDEIVIGDYWVTIRRGPGELDPRSFELRDIVTDRFGILPT